MEKKHVCGLAFMALCMLASMNPSNAQSLRKDEFKPFLTRGQTTWSISGGARVNNFDWNVASDATGTASPNILSELTWRDVVMLEAETEVRHEIPIEIPVIDSGIHLEAKVHAGVPIAGENQDSDFNSDNRTDEFSRTIADVGGYSVGGAAAVGYKIYLTGDPTRQARAIAKNSRAKTAKQRARKTQALRKSIDDNIPAITLTPLAGYAVHQQRYSMNDVVRKIPPAGLIGVGDFDWHYLSTWYGPFYGLESEIIGKKNKVRLRGQYQDASFYGEGYWRARTAFRQDPSFTQEAEGDAYLFNLQYAYALGEESALTVDANYETRSAENGIDKLFFVNNTTAITRLNEVNDESYGLRLGWRRNW